ncbi:ATP-dependent nuclease [Miltoncostaea oceani]|uniref:ATP-dependent nuclease n=1 Tax=Miltoncostaea oceani TaxID=2843216 RepID=UPI001C3CA14B|nr:AAA family ATPase [Miltoncostaea oceani]
MSAALKHVVEQAGLDPDRYGKATTAEVVAALEADPAVEAAVALAEELKGRDLEAEVRHRVASFLPRFQYFDDYNILPGSVSITRLQEAGEDDLDAAERTALALMRLAGVDGDEFTEASYEARKAALEAAANQLTDELFEYWTQNADLSVELDIEFRPSERGAGTEPWLQIRVRNQRHRVTLNMAERSKGFIWFFSFLAAFSEFAGETKRIILLDEPGLNLHAKAQNDLLRFIDERLAPHHQVIYSTHSLFMIQPDHLERCRTVEDVDDDGTQVSQEVWTARSDTVFPLLGALGVDLAQTLIIGPDQLVVEGPADVVYLSVLSAAAADAGRVGLDPRWTIVPVGGLDKIPTFIALLGASDLNLAVLLDVAAGGNQRIANLVSRGLLDEKRLVPVNAFTGTAEADLEDLFDVGWYLKLVAASGIGKFAKSKLPPGPRIVRRIESALGGPYDHFRPANRLLRDPGGLLGELDDATLSRFAALFERLNELLS